MRVREVFTPGLELVARKSFTCRGVKYAPGQVFDTSAVDERRLRQMYEGRWLTVRGSDEVAAAKKAEKAKRADKPSGLLNGLFGT